MINPADVPSPVEKGKRDEVGFSYNGVKKSLQTFLGTLKFFSVFSQKVFRASVV